MEERTRHQRRQSGTDRVSIFTPSPGYFGVARSAALTNQSSEIARSPSGLPAIGHDLSRISILPPESGEANQSETKPENETADLNAEPVQRAIGHEAARSSSRPRWRHDLSQISVSSVQAKLTVSQPNDPYEQEAERMGEQVMRMEVPTRHQPSELQGEAEAGQQNQTCPLADLARRGFLQRTALVSPQQKAEWHAQYEQGQRFGHNLSRISVLRPQTQLDTSQEGKPHQQEDGVADKVRRVVAPGTSTDMSYVVSQEAVQRKCAACEEEEEAVQMKSSPEQTLGDESQQASSDIESQLSRSKGGGSPLSEEVRSFMEPRFGADFSGVRVHTDSTATQMNKELRAQAFTHSSDIYYGAGKSPGNNDLTAHELTHVVQQTGQVQLKEGTASATPALAKDGDSSASSPTVSAPTEKAQVSGAAPIPTPAPATTGDTTTGASVIPSTNGKQNGKVGTADTPTTAVSGKASSGASSSPTTPSKNVVTTGKDGAAPTAASGKAKTGNAATGSPALKTSDAAASKAPEAIVAANVSNDAKLQQIHEHASRTGQAASAHPPTGHMVGAAQAAAPTPSNETTSKARAVQAGQMNAAPADANKDNFLALLRSKLKQKLEAIAPKNNQEFKDFGKSGKAGAVQAELTQQVQGQNQQAQGPIANTTNAPPPTDQVTPQPTGPAPPAPAPATLPPVQPGLAVPTPSPGPAAGIAEQTHAAEQSMADAKITPEQIQKANDPRFSAVNQARDQMHASAATAPAQFQEHQQTVLNTTDQAAQNAQTTDLAQMQVAHTQAHAGAYAEQQAVMTRDAQKRQEVANNIEKLFEETKGKVEAKLNEIGPAVDQMFTEGEQAARKQFEDEVDRRTNDHILKHPIDALVGWAEGKDPALEEIWQQERQHYIDNLDAVLERIADRVEQGLKEAKDLIAEGHKAIETYVAGLAPELRQSGEQADQNIGSHFEELQHSIDAKREELANHLVERYQTAQQEIDKRIKELEDAHRGLVGSFLDKLEAVKQALEEFKKRLQGVVTNAEETMDLIIKDPIAFLNHLLDALKQGFKQFWANISTHLKKGLMGWIFSTLADAGIQMPQEFDIKGIGMLVLQVLGITWVRIRGKIEKIIGPRAMAFIEKVVSYATDFLQGGIEGLWEHIKQDLSNLKEMVIGAIENWLVTTIVKSAIEKLVAMSNPAGAIVEAVIEIYETVKFFIDQAGRIVTLVETIVRSVQNIAMGAIGDAANWIENAMGNTIPIMITFLADLIGLGGLSDNIQNFVQKTQAVVDQAIDKALAFIVEKAKSLFGKGDKDDGEAPKSDHEKLAEQATFELQQIEGEPEDYETLRKQKEEQARQIEQSYAAKLEQGIKLSVNFKDAAPSEADDELDFDVIIAPNDTISKGSVKYHNLYEPKNLKLRKGRSKDIPVVITYETYKGATFEVMMGKDDTVKSILGKHLQLKKKAGVKERGITQDISTHAENMGLNKSHLIADEFMGSGYAESLNLITTSAYYNQKIMRDQEKAIKASIIDFEANEFDLEVNITWGTFSNAKIVKKIMTDSEISEKYKDQNKLRSKLERFLNEHNEITEETMKRCINVEYTWILKIGSKSQTFGPVAIGPDIWIGLD